MGFHLFPFRTEKLSPFTPMVLRQARGRVGSRLFKPDPLRRVRLLCVYESRCDRGVRGGGRLLLQEEPDGRTHDALPVSVGVGTGFASLLAGWVRALPGNRYSKSATFGTDIQGFLIVS